MSEERILGYTSGQPVINTQVVLNAKGPFGAIDALDPDARLRVLIETAQNHRSQNPDAPVRAAELAVNEVLRLRGKEELLHATVARLREAASWHLNNYTDLKAENAHLAAALKWERTPWYDKLVGRLSYWLVTGVRP